MENKGKFKNRKINFFENIFNLGKTIKHLKKTFRKLEIARNFSKNLQN